MQTFIANTRAFSRPAVYSPQGMEGFSTAREAYRFARRLARLRRRTSVDRCAAWSVARASGPVVASGLVS